MKKYLFLLLGIDFFALTMYALIQQNMFTYISNAVGQPWGVHSLVELCLLLTLGGVWMYKDAKKHSISSLPFFVLFACSGVAGIFFYLWKRETVLEGSHEKIAQNQFAG